MDLNRIVVEPPATRAGSKVRVWLIKYESRVIGYLEKFRPERDYVHPWKAFVIDGGGTRPNTMVGIFYDAEHGGNANAKQTAIAAVIKAKGNL